MFADAVMRTDATPGLFGKMPCRGDFVRRRLPDSFVGPWDAWLQTVLAHSRARLGEAWLDVYLTSPIWRFALTPGVCGEAMAAGVLMPSVDAVNRHFPLTVAALLPPETSPFAVAEASAWFRRVEALALSCLAEGLDADALDALCADVDGLGDATRRAADGDGAATAACAIASAPAIRCGIDWETGGLAGSGVLVNLLDQLAERAFGSFTLWWTLGSDRVAPCFVIHGGLPSGDAFIDFLCDQRPPGPPPHPPAPSDRDPSDACPADDENSRGG